MARVPPLIGGVAALETTIGFGSGGSLGSAAVQADIDAAAHSTVSPTNDTRFENDRFMVPPVIRADPRLPRHL
jgi:hypothetical protein